MIATPSTTFGDESNAGGGSGGKERRQVEYREVLGYARRIAGISMPPGGYIGFGATNINGGIEAGGAGDAGGENAGLQVPGAPVIPHDALPATTQQSTSQQTQSQATGSATQTPTPTSTPIVTTTEITAMIPAQTQQDMNPQQYAPWVPWPKEEDIRRGILAELQYEQVTGGLKKGGEGEGKAGEVEEKKEEGAGQGAGGVKAVEAEGGEATVPVQRTQQQPRQERVQPKQVFEGLGLLDDDDDDED